MTLMYLERQFAWKAFPWYITSKRTNLFLEDKHDSMKINTTLDINRSRMGWWTSQTKLFRLVKEVPWYDGKNTVYPTAQFAWGITWETKFWLSVKHCIVVEGGAWLLCINGEKVLMSFSFALHILSSCYALCATPQTKPFTLVKEVWWYDLLFPRHTHTHTEYHCTCCNGVNLGWPPDPAPKVECK